MVITCYRDLGYEMTLKCANFKSSCFVPVCSNFTVAFRFSPVSSMLTTVPLPKRWCSMTLPTFKDGISAEGLELVALPPFAMALDTLDHLPVCLNFCSNDSEKGFTAVSALWGVVNFGLGSAMNCPATGLEFCIRPLRRAYPSPQSRNPV